MTRPESSRAVWNAWRKARLKLLDSEKPQRNAIEVMLWCARLASARSRRQHTSRRSRMYSPTVRPLSGITPDMRIFHEESFGSVTSIIKVRDAEEALELANATDYGLSSGVITNNMQKALDLAFGLDAGMVHLNDCTVSDEPHVPFGGVKNGGYGREGGRFSMEEMTELKWITVQRGQRAPSPRCDPGAGLVAGLAVACETRRQDQMNVMPPFSTMVWPVM
jgi:delta 1-pyrroline-5-carboxylate dehydrogenase